MTGNQSDWRTEWRFIPRVPGETNQDPMIEDLFSQEEVGGLAGAVVRESIQNSLDADQYPADPEHVVHVRFRFGTCAPSQLKPFLNGLAEHLRAPGSGALSPDSFDTIPYLVVEDFGTTGLEGGPREDEVPTTDDGLPHNYYYFWRHIAASGKHGQRGTRGVGRTVYSDISDLRSFFGLTRRQGDGRRLLSGLSILMGHRVGEVQYRSCGRLGHYEHPGEYLEHPVEDSSFVNEFEGVFGLDRSVDCGLSVVIPCPRPTDASDEPIDRTSIAQACLEQYLYPILSGKLQIRIAGDDSTVDLTSETVAQSLDTSLLPRGDDAETFRQRLEFMRWALSIGPENLFSPSGLPQCDRMPVWRDVSFDDSDVEVMRERFDAGQRIAFEIPVKVFPIDGAREFGHFRVHLQRDDNVGRGEVHFIRQGLRISGAGGRPPRGVRAVVTIDADPLAGMLASAENPAHTDWQRDVRTFRNRYEHGPTVLQFVKNSVHGLVNVIADRGTEVDRDLFKDIFSLPLDSAGSRRGPGGTEGPEGPSGPQHPIVPSDPDIFSISKLHNRGGAGFRVKANGSLAAGQVPDYVVVRSGYVKSRGNPIKGYRRWHFDLAHMTVEPDGVEILAAGGNVVVARITRPDFKLNVQGFDQNRDVAAAAQSIEKAAAAALATEIRQRGDDA